MYRTFAKLTLVATSLAAALACTNSGLQGTPTGLTNPTQTPTPNPQPTGGGGDCEFDGTWELNKVWCGNFEIDSDWFAVYSSATMVISDSGAGDGSCAVDFSWAGSECSEDEQWEITETTAQTWSIRFGGISSCAPDQCTFFPSDGSCTIGDRSDNSPIDFEIDVLQASQIRITGLFGDDTIWGADSGYPQCTLDLVTEWTK